MMPIWIVYYLEVIILTKEKRNRSGLDQEEFGYGFDLSPDDLDIREENNETKQNRNDAKEKTKYKNKSSIEEK